jgi:peptidoglycan/xylan/chitin deacetylase (PgdA/CDA1 family)
MLYFIKSPKWLQLLYPNRIWQMDKNKKEIYLTFDDGPHATITNFVLDELNKYNAEATFFCVGNNVVKNPDVYNRIIYEGHAVGNHSYSHLNGFKTKDKIYVDDVFEASKYIDSNFFRPPYGRLKIFQAKVLTHLNKPYKIIMWTLLSGDFDLNISPGQCLENVLLKISNGAIVIFHDSEKAAERMIYALPKVLKTLSDKGYTFKKISTSQFE